MQIIGLSQTRDPFKQRYPHVLQCRILPILLFKTSIFQKPLKEKQTTTITWNSWWEFESPELRKTLLLRLKEWATDYTKTWDLNLFASDFLIFPLIPFIAIPLHFIVNKNFIHKFCILFSWRTLKYQMVAFADITRIHIFLDKPSSLCVYNH